MIEYSDAVQAILANYAIVIFGYACGAAKLFGLKDASAVRRIVFKISLPALIFRQIGRRQLTLDDWQPFLNELLVQATIHLVLAIFCFAIPFKNKRLTYLQALFALSYTNLIFFGYPIVQVLFGNDQTYIPCMMNIVQFLFVIPFHSFLIYGSKESESESESNASHHDNDSGSGIELEEAEHMGGPITKVEEENDGETPAAPAKPAEKAPEQPSTESDHEEESESEKPPTRAKAVLWTLVTPLNVCAVLGILWSATKWTMPMFLDQFANDLEKAVMGAGMFSIGLFMWEHPLCNFNIPLVGMFLVLHFVASPLISALWAWAVGMDKLQAKVCTLSRSMPSGLMGYIMSINCGYGMKTASFTFFWSNVFALIVLICWVVVFNELKLFDEDDVV